MALSEKARFVADYLLRARPTLALSLAEIRDEACRAWLLVEAAEEETRTIENEKKAAAPSIRDIRWRPMSELLANRRPTRWILVWVNGGPDVYSSASLEIKESMLWWAEIPTPELSA